MKKAFSLYELIIIVAILGILAAIAVPQFQNHSQQAKESAAKDNLRILRNAIEIYTAQHNSTPPGYYNDNLLPAGLFYPQLSAYTDIAGNAIGSPAENHPYGPYISEIPENPFNKKASITILENAENFPTVADGSSGWVYKPATKQIRLNYPGTDSEDNAYYDY
ncbi:type IV pilin protein [Planctomycetota bacterium]